MFSQEQEQIKVVPTSEGFTLDMRTSITKLNIEKIKKTLTKTLESSSINQTNTTKIDYHVDSVGGDIECFFIFNDFMKELKEKYPKIEFRSVAYYVDGVGALIYMLADERITTNRSSISFSCIYPTNENILNNSVRDARNQISRIFMEKGYNIMVINKCLPSSEDKVMVYCRDVCHDEGFSTKHIDQ